MKRWYRSIQFISIGIFAGICFLSPPAVSYFFLALLFVRITLFLRPTRGKKIREFEKSKNALLVIDMQEALCGKGGDYPQKEKFVEEVNQFIVKAQQQRQPIIYIVQEFSIYDFIFCFLAMGSRLLQSTKGASLCSDLMIVGNTTFIKHHQDAFTSKKLNDYLNENSIDSVSIVGLDSSSCVYKTALGAANRGYHVTVIRQGVLGKNSVVTEKALQKLSGKGIEIN